ncbi:MAG: PilX N-terminal domain-containing pilus assembly protein [Vulcanimicrobiota bacterium]
MRNRRGIAIIVVLMVLALLALIAAGMATMGSDNLRVVYADQKSAISLYAADAGARATIVDVANGTVAATTVPYLTNQAMATVDGSSVEATYSVDVYGPGATPPNWTNALPTDTFYILSTGRSKDGPDRHAGVVVKLTSSNYPNAIFAANRLVMAANCTTDTWDSSVGSYATSRVIGAGQAHVGVNSTSPASVVMDATSQLDPLSPLVATGNVLVPPGAPPTAVVGTPFLSYSSLQYMPQPQPLPPVDMEGTNTAAASAVGSGPPGPQFDASGYLLPGVYGDVVVSGWDLKLRQGQTYFFETLDVSAAGSTVSLEPSATTATTVKIRSGVTLAQDAVVNTSGNPGLLQMQVQNSPPGGVIIAGGTQAFFAFYGPTTNVTMVGGDLYGSVVGDQIIMAASSSVHYDQALADAPGGASTADILNFRRW